MTIQDLAEKQHHTSSRLRFSVRYHQRRARFFDGCDLWGKAASVLFGTAAIGALLHQEEGLLQWAAGLVTFAGTMSLVFSFSQKTRLHLDLARKYLELEAKFIRSDLVDASFLRDIDADIRIIEGQEPPPLGALVVLCQNEIARQDGNESHIVDVPTHQRLLANFIDFSAPKPNLPS